MLAVASNLFGKSSSLAAYSLHQSGPSPSSSSSNLPSTSSSGSTSKTFNVGLWKVIGATHKTTGKDVSVWVFEKKILDGVKMDGAGRSAQQGREWVLEQLKKEAGSLSRLRHPDILHMVEPLEDTRSELTFVTEVITGSLGNLLSAAGGKPRRANGTQPPPSVETTGEVDLDEVEIQKGVLQIAKGLGFLHQQAKMVHLNLSPDAILVNAKGDWKLSGLNLTTPLVQPDGTATKYVYPEVEARLPPQVQWKLDYLAPEYALDSKLSPSNDLYSLGCVLYAVHMGGKPPFRNQGSMQSLRDHAENSLARRDWASGSKWERCSAELKDLLPRLLTRQPSNRLSLASLPSHPFFSSLAISTLNFLDPTTFASKPREEKATFLRGLVRVLPGFSDRLRKGKVLLSLLEEMKDPYLLPFILPNVFFIAKTLTKDEFGIVLPKLQPLFTLVDPPQNMLTLLEHLSLFEEKTSPQVFRENIMPLIYNSLECEHLPVQEKVLKTVPHLCEILDYGTVQNVLLVKIAILFTRTKILSVKVDTLDCFQAMVKILDKSTLTTKLVPLLAKIKTKEPAVMMATLGVHEAMGLKVDREAVASLVLPQLWAMSMGPLLNADQFTKFMTVIKALGARVEQEHSQHLRDVRRIEDQTSSITNGFANGGGFNMNLNGGDGGEVDFETLVKGGSGMAVTQQAAAVVTDPWADNGWGDTDLDTNVTQNFSTLSLLSTSALQNFPTSFPSSPMPTTTSLSPSRNGAGSSRLKARPIPPTAFNSAAFGDPSPATPPSIPSYNASTSTYAPMQPTQSTSQPPAAQRPSASGPNYSLNLTPQAPIVPMQPTPSYTFAPPPQAQQPRTTYQPSQPAQAIAQPTITPTVKPPPGWSPGLMQPTAAPKPAWGTGGTTAKQDWGDFDPLK